MEGIFCPNGINILYIFPLKERRSIFSKNTLLNSQKKYLTNGEESGITYTKDDFKIQSLIDRNSTLKRGFKGKTGLTRQIANFKEVRENG